MPLPTPRADEDERGFMARCMGDDGVQNEFDKQEQRVAVCLNRWRTKKEAAGVETKTISCPIEIKSIEQDQRQFTGLASTWDIDLDGDRMAPGCFKRSIDNGRRIPLLNRHQSADITRDVLGHSIAMEETPAGLLGTFEVADTRAGEDAWRLIKKGSVGALSIGFIPKQRGVEKTFDPATGKPRNVRVLKEVKLMEVSLVPFPANEGALIDLASVKEALAARDLSDVDRDALELARAAIALRLGEPEPEPEAEPEPDATSLPDPPPILELEAKLRVLTSQRDAAADACDFTRAEEIDARCRGTEMQLKRKRREYDKMRQEIEALEAELVDSKEQLESSIAVAEFETAAVLKSHVAAVEGRLTGKRARYLQASSRPAVLMPDSPLRLARDASLAKMLARSAMA